MCTVLLPQGDNPIAVNKYIKYPISPEITEGSFMIYTTGKGVIDWLRVCVLPSLAT